ncbi:SoxR reducing system RseC family protein [Crenobacter caeni]|uniref:SoxR reducing system RseC family protein n=1 Tax=Crenobacter caeni TaxID=2705474 RepID=A0A6B2KV72_9NEIS|nr:SoxR reducing system RseC family protein [Crenobacter caeni]NDV13940.1 SoxR reducing system RseC family protein [Crenobacter caeni]
MTEAEARVLSVEPGHAWVEPQPHSPCGHCDPVNGCRSMSIARLFGGATRFRVLDPLGVAPGDKVFVSVPEGGVLGSALLMYLAPLSGLVAGALLGNIAGEAFAVAGAVLGAAAALFWARRRAALLAGDARYVPAITRRFDPTLSTMEMPRRCRSGK